MHFSATRAYAELRGDATDLTTSAPRTQGSNTTLKVGERLFLKFYRKLQPGLNPELEIGRYLTEVAHFPDIVPVAGAVEYRSEDGTTFTLALLQAFVTNQGDGWDYTVEYLVRFLEDRRTAGPLPEDAHGAYLALIRTLATRTAELHGALAAATTDPAFAPEPIGARDLSAWKQQVVAEIDETLKLLAIQVPALPENIRSDADALLGERDLLLQRIERCASAGASGLKTRHHGDYHLGQVLLRRNDFVIVDFEGEPARPLSERRAKHSPLRDVAGMFRSFAYARNAARLRCSIESSEDCARWDGLMIRWEEETRQAFLEVYDPIARSHGLYASLAEAQPLIELFEIEKALYELRYEMQNRPDWAGIPLRSLLERYRT